MKRYGRFVEAWGVNHAQLPFFRKQSWLAIFVTLSCFDDFSDFPISDQETTETWYCVCTMMSLRKTGTARCRRLKRPPIPHSRLTQEHFFENLKIEESNVGDRNNRILLDMVKIIFLHYMALGRVWYGAKYSHRVWQRFAHRFESLKKYQLYQSPFWGVWSTLPGRPILRHLTF